MGIFEVVVEYTGLSPAAFFTIAGMMVMVYRYVTGMFVALEEYNKPPVVAAANSSALLSFKPQDINGNIQGLGPDELQILHDWEDKFIEKYVKVGQLLLQPQPEPEPEPTETQQT